MSEDFKNEESNVPPEKRVEKTTEKTEQKKVGGFEEFVTGDSMPPSKSDSKKIDVICSLNQFVSFVDATESIQKGIVKGQKYPPKEKFFYYQTSNASISKSILQSDTKPLYSGIDKLKNSSPIGTQKIRNKVNSIEAIESFLKMKLPEDFTILDKEKYAYLNEPLRVFGVWVKVTPNVIFKTKIKDQIVIGAIKLHSAKTSHFNKLRMKIVAHLLKKFLERLLKDNKDGHLILPKYCLCVDVFAQSLESAPVGTDEPNLKLERASLEYIKKWGEI